MPATYFPSLNPNGIDMNTMPNLSEVFTAPRGQDPMYYGFKGSKGPQSPFAPLVGQAADALMDPRLGMLPMVGGFRAAGAMGRVGRKAAEISPEGIAGRAHTNNMNAMSQGMLEQAPLPHQQAMLGQAQGDQSMGKAIQGLAESMGWSSEKMADWLVQNGFRSGR